MKTALVFLLSALALKETSFINSPYVLRGFSQGLCFILGGLWSLKYISFSHLGRYWPLFGYIAALLLSTIGSRQPVYISFQVISFSAVVIFFIAYYESKKGDRLGVNELLSNTTIILYTLVAVSSVVLWTVAPAFVYKEYAYSADRFKGIFGTSAAIGISSGLLIGMSYFGIKRFWLKVIPLLSGGICLLLSQARTAWISMIIAGGLTIWLYSRNGRKQILVGLAICSFSVVSILVFDLPINKKHTERFARTESIKNLTGRDEMWKAGIDSMKKGEHLFLGHGFTMGSLGAGIIDKRLNKSRLSIDEARVIAKTTLHSGYFQSLLDTGLIGSFFYLSALFLAIKRIYERDIFRAFPVEFFSIVFLMISNITENSIYSVTVLNSVLFWGLSVFALSLRIPLQSSRRFRALV